jgi:hypothetical protein
MRERVKLDEAAGLRGESIGARGVGRGSTAEASDAEGRRNVTGEGGNAILGPGANGRTGDFWHGPDGQSAALAGQGELREEPGGSRGPRS